MADKSAQQKPRGRSLGDARGERYGPLVITRTRKDDGRVLLLYERDQPAAGERRQAAAGGEDRDRDGGERP